MRIFKPAVSIISGLVLLPAGASPAPAAPAGEPMTCGMVVREDAVLYLAEDLFCPDFGVRVTNEPAEPGPAPHVLVDLRGHTLSGPGTGVGIGAANSGGDATFLQVVNGRLENWDSAVSGEWDTRTRKVELAGNRFGFFCSGICVADRTRFTDNTGTGFFVAGEAAGTVTRSTFEHNVVGASVFFPWRLSVSRSTFRENGVGVFNGGSQVPVHRSKFVRNQTAIVVDNGDEPGACVDLEKVVFVQNGVRVDGPICPA